MHQAMQAVKYLSLDKLWVRALLLLIIGFVSNSVRAFDDSQLSGRLSRVVTFVLCTFVFYA